MTNTAVTFGTARQGNVGTDNRANENLSAARQEFKRLMGGATQDNAQTLQSQSLVGTNRSSGDPAPVSMHSRSNVAPVALKNVGTVGGSNGQSALFMNDQEKISIDTLRNTLNTRFSDGIMTAKDLTETFNVDQMMAHKFVRHHGKIGDPDNMSNAAFVRHVERWQDEDGKLDQARFKSAIFNGASHININRFEHEVGKGVEFRGFLEAYRRAGGNLPEEALSRIYNRYKDRDLKGNDEILERSELLAMGLPVDGAGDVPVAEFRKALNALAFTQQSPAPPPPANDATNEKTPPPAKNETPKTGNNGGNNGGSQTVQAPGWPWTINQQGNIQNIFGWPFPGNGNNVQQSIFNSKGTGPMAGPMNSTGQSGNTPNPWRNNLKSIW